LHSRVSHPELQLELLDEHDELEEDDDDELPFLLSQQYLGIFSL